MCVRERIPRGLLLGIGQLRQNRFAFGRQFRASRRKIPLNRRQRQSGIVLPHGFGNGVQNQKQRTTILGKETVSRKLETTNISVEFDSVRNHKGNQSLAFCEKLSFIQKMWKVSKWQIQEIIKETEVKQKFKF